MLIARGARLRAPFVSLGVTAEAGSSALLPQRVGWQNAAHLLFNRVVGPHLDPSSRCPQYKATAVRLHAAPGSPAP